MKHEIIKKTLVYRPNAFIIGLLIPFLITKSVASGFIIGLITESTTLAFYYTFEHLWKKFVSYMNLKAGQQLFITSGDKHGWYNVVEVIDENKFVIEVV